MTQDEMKESLMTALTPLADLLASIQNESSTEISELKTTIASLVETNLSQQESLDMLTEIIGNFGTTYASKSDVNSVETRLIQLQKAVRANIDSIKSISELLGALSLQVQDVAAVLQELQEGLEETPPEEPPVEEEPSEPTNPEVPTELLPMRGANFAGLGNNQWFNPCTQPSKLGTHYRTSALRSNQPDYFGTYSAGMLEGGLFINRENYALERIVDARGAEPVLNEAYCLEIEEMMNAAGEKGGRTVLDQHNYCRLYQPTEFNADGTLKYPKLKRTQSTVNGVTVDVQWFPIGHHGCWINYEKWAKIYKMIALRFKDNPYLLAYGISNEPHNRGTEDDGLNVQEMWIDGVRLIQDAIRSVDTKTWISVAGCAYSTAKNWRSVSDRLRYTVDLTDPRVMFEAHQYPDINGDGGGGWKKGTLHKIDPVARVNDWENVRQWCAEVGKPLYAGEFGCPVEYEKWTADSGGTFEYNYAVEGAEQYLNSLYAYFTQHGIVSTQWLAGPGDSDTYANGMDRNDGTLKPNANALMSCIGEMATYKAPVATA